MDLAQTRHSVREVHSLMARQIHLFRQHRQVRVSHWWDPHTAWLDFTRQWWTYGWRTSIA